MDEFCPLITVGVVVLNREWIIDKMLASLQSQTYPHDHIFVILVDGGSTDKTVEKAKRILEKADFNGYEIIIKKCTIPEGRNICIEKMRGALLLFWDSDIIMEPNAMWKFVKTMEKENAEIVSTHAIFVFINSINELETKIKSTTEHKREDFLYDVPGVGMGHTLISKKVFEVLRFDPDLTTLEDFYFSVRARRHGFKLLINEGIRVFDVNIMKKGYSDIHIDMSLKDALRGIRKKAYAQVMANNFKITFKSMINFFLQNKRYIFYLGYIPAVILSLYGIFSINIYTLIVFPLYFFSFTLWQIKRRGLTRGTKATVRSILVGVPTAIYILYYFIKCAVTKSRG
jgi:glycosyltransferase involved in cell wall biosynthesis